MIREGQRWKQLRAELREEGGEFFEPEVVEAVSRMVGRLDLLLARESAEFYKSLREKKREKKQPISGKAGASSVPGSTHLSYRVTPQEMDGHVLGLTLIDRGNDSADRPVVIEALAPRGKPSVEVIIFKYPDTVFGSIRKIYDFLKDNLPSDVSELIRSTRSEFRSPENWNFRITMSAIELCLARSGMTIDLGDVDGEPFVVNRVTNASLRIFGHLTASDKRTRGRSMACSEYFKAGEIVFDQSGQAINVRSGRVIDLHITEFDTVLKHFEDYIDIEE